MENKGLWVGVGAVVIALVALVLALRTPVSVFVAGSGSGSAQTSEQRFGGTTGLDSLLLRGTLTVDGASTLTGALGLSSSIRVGASGTPIDLIKVATTTVDANSLSNGGATSSVITVTGASLNDHVSVGLTGSWAAPSSSAVVSGSVTAADTVTIYFKNTSSTAVNLTDALYVIKVTSP